MSKKSSKQRHCPAVDRGITAVECGENRGSRYQCPADCPHNPYAPQNYSQLLQLEDVLNPKCMERLREQAKDSASFEKALQQALHHHSLHAAQAFYAWHLFFKRDEAGLSFAERWEKAGFTGLKNDERVLLRAKMRMRVVLLEIRRVIDNERIEAVDLLSPGSAPILLRDRSLASMAVRFVSGVTWIYPLPHYWRLSGTAALIPELAQFEPIEIVTEIVRHLGGPPTALEMPLWLAENVVRFSEALTAVARARRMRMFAGLNAQFGKALYEMHAPFAECRGLLDDIPAVEPDDLAGVERDEGFAEARVWFDETPAVRRVPGAGRPALGRVLLGQSHWRLEAMGEDRLARLRGLFEARLGGKVRFAGERQDNLGATLAGKEPRFDESLVPPKLLEQPEQILLTSSRVPAAPKDLPPEQVEAEFMAAEDRAFLDDSIPALDGRTPREAARDPVLRPKLIRLLKQRVRSTDEHNLRTGGTLDINWMLRELGANEILFDPPPWRPPPDAGADAGDDDELFEDDYTETDFEHLPPAPPLPPQPLTHEEACERLQAGIEAFDTAEQAMDELEASGSTILDDAYQLTADLLDEKASAFLTTFLLQAWYALVPRGCRAPRITFQALAEAFDREQEMFLDALGKRTPEALMQYLQDSPQPALAQVITLGVMEVEKRAPKEARPTAEAQICIVALLKALIAELDRTLRSRMTGGAPRPS